MKIIFRVVLVVLFIIPFEYLSFGQSFTMDAIKSYPFPANLTASAIGSKIAWTVNEEGKRNIYVAEGSDFAPRKITNYNSDDGQEITSLSVSANGQTVVYERGGDHGSNWDDNLSVNPSFTPTPLNVQIWSVPFKGGEPKLLGEGHGPIISPKNDIVIFEKGNQFWNVPIDGSSAAKILFTAHGVNGSAEFSPDGSKLAFVSNRGDHSFVGVYTNEETPISWISPSFNHDRSPRWSPDGTRLAFVRMNGSGGAPRPLLTNQHQPWAIWVAEVASGNAKMIWKAEPTLRGSFPTTEGLTNLNWGAGDRIVFLSNQDGWPHLYSMPSTGGTATLLTPGNFMAEYITMSPDRKWIMFCGNTGSSPLDIDRRHVVRVAVDKAGIEVLTPGDGIEWTPVVTGDGAYVAMISATAKRPPLPAVMAFNKGTLTLLGQNLIPAKFPESKLVVPKQVIIKSPDGLNIHGQLFEGPGNGKKPAVIYVHGGPPRQMLLGWNYSDYYSNAYASNQYLASLGFAVLSVNYRLGIGYGYEFHQPANAGTAGASEYIDVKAAGEWLAKQPNIDANKIGIYGGSYGGFLTALALGRDSKLFAAGVDIHGVHDRTLDRTRNIISPDRFEKAPDAEKALQVAWESSPVSSVSTWTSPVLMIHGDDDRNVRFSQTTDLVARLREKGVAIETLVIVDDTHHWMKHSNAIKINQATADYFKKKLMK